MPLIFIDIWLKLLRENYCARSESYSNDLEEMFKQITQNVERSLTSKGKKGKMMTDIGGGWYLEKCKKGLPPLKRTKLGKKAQKRQDRIKKEFFVSNMWWNDWKFQLHWNKLEWVDPISTPKRVKTFSVSAKIYILVKMIEQLILLVILN